MPFVKADRAKVEAVVRFLDAGNTFLHAYNSLLPCSPAVRCLDGNGHMDVKEVKVLISSITGLPPEKIPDKHHEVLAHPQALRLLPRVAPPASLPSHTIAASVTAPLVCGVRFVCRLVSGWR